ncbi:MAG: aspartate aminotransferase family protein [Nitrososphaerota archaeon]|nr:aspartate aminotransferase family protein [Nitrososphaerota archaeon]
MQSREEQTGLEHLFLDFMQMKEFAKNPVIMKSASGVWYKDVNGKKYLDGLSGIFVVNVGHGNRRVIDAIHQQLEELVFAPPLHSTNLKAIELAKAVSGLTPGDLHTMKFFSGGSESTEAAVKLAKQYHKQTGNPGKYKVISRYQSYHGSTMGALGASGTTKRKTPFEPFGPGYVKVFPPTCYRCPYGLNYPECDVLCASIVEKVVKEEDPHTVAAFMVEPIGNTGGIITPPPEYFRILREICDKYNIVLIFDEVITGFGRTGEWFAAQTFGTTPDIICMGKGISSGYTPMGGLAISDRIAKAFLGSGDQNLEFAHGNTFGGNPLSAAIALANIQEMKERDLPAKAKKRGAQVWQRLEEMKELGVVGDIRGKGLLVGVEFVRDPKTKKQFPESMKFGSLVGKKALQKGLVLRFDPHWIAFAPPLIISEEETDKMMDIFEESLRETLASVN